MSASKAIYSTSLPVGSIDVICGNTIIGWAWNYSDHSVSVAVFIDQEEIAQVCADQFRSDLLNSGIGSGVHGFSVRIPEQWADGKPHKIAVRVIESNQALPGSGKIYRRESPRCSAIGSEANVIENGDFRLWSRGLWFERPESGEEIADNWFIDSAGIDPKQLYMYAEHSEITIKGKAKPAVRHGLALSLDAVEKTVRLKTKILCTALSDRQNYNLSIQAYSKYCKNLPRLSSIAGIFFSRADTLLHQFARDVTLTGIPQKYHFRIPKEVLMRLVWQEDSEATIELVFEIKGPASIMFLDINLVPQTKLEVDHSQQEQGRFEDINMAAQLARVPILKAWTLPPPVHGSFFKGENSRKQGIRFAKCVQWERPSLHFPSIDIVVCVHNSLDDVALCIKSLEANTSLPYLLTIVDDASDEATRSLIVQYKRGRPWVSIIRNEQQLGYTRAANSALRRCRSDVVVLLNSDTVATPGWLERLCVCAASDPEIGMVGPLTNAGSWQSIPDIKTKKGEWKVNALPPGTNANDIANLVTEFSESAFPQVPLLNGFCMLIRREVIDQIGLFDEENFPYGYGEENDYCIRAARAGFKLAIADDVYIYHAKSKSYGHKQRKKLSHRGNEALARLYPDVDWASMEGQMVQLNAVNLVRHKLKERLSLFEKNGLLS